MQKKRRGVSLCLFCFFLSGLVSISRYFDFFCFLLILNFFWGLLLEGELFFFSFRLRKLVEMSVKATIVDQERIYSIKEDAQILRAGRARRFPEDWFVPRKSPLLLAVQYSCKLAPWCSMFNAHKKRGWSLEAGAIETGRLIGGSFLQFPCQFVVRSVEG